MVGGGEKKKQPKSIHILCSLAFQLHSSAGVIAKGKSGSVLLPPQEESPHGQQELGSQCGAPSYCSSLLAAQRRQISVVPEKCLLEMLVSCSFPFCLCNSNLVKG